MRATSLQSTAADEAEVLSWAVTAARQSEAPPAKGAQGPMSGRLGRPEGLEEEEPATEGVGRCMAKASLNLQPLDGSKLEQVKTLQEAVRNHGRVDLMKEVSTGRFSAVKRMPNEWVCANHADFLQDHPNSSELPWFDVGVVMFLHSRGFPYCAEPRGVFKDKTHTYVVSGFASGGDLFAWCDRGPPLGSEREAAMRPMVRQFLSATSWLHELGIGHRDISLENILLTTDEQGRQNIKLIDFGMATLQRRCVSELRGKQSYQAPEMHVGKQEYDSFAHDTFSLGVVIYGMAAADYPWYATKAGKCQLWDYYSSRSLRSYAERRKARKGNGKLIDIFSPALLELLQGLVQISPRERVTLGESCFDAELRESRQSVWDLDWLNQWS